jgi:hypothetical protein
MSRLLHDDSMFPEMIWNLPCSCRVRNKHCNAPVSVDFAFSNAFDTLNVIHPALRQRKGLRELHGTILYEKETELLFGDSYSEKYLNECDIVHNRPGRGTSK